MSVTIRLNKELENFIDSESKNEGITKSELIRQCIEDYYEKLQNKKTPWELGKDYFGKNGSGDPYLSRDRKKIIREKIHAKKSNN